MKLSVVIPVYNGADFIQKSYNSILNQHIDEFEILYIENNSNDNSVECIQNIMETDGRVKIYYQTKQGAAAARNMGIEKSEGDYIYIFDVDDEIYPNALLSMISVLDAYPQVEAVFGKMVKSYKGIALTEKPTDETHEVILKDPPYWGIQWFSSLRNVVGPPGFLYRQGVFDKIGCYNADLKNDEDTALDIKLGMTSHVAFLDMYVYLYFKHQHSTIQQTKKKGTIIFHTWNRYVKEHLPFYLENEVPDRYKEILFGQLFGTMGKIIFYTKGWRRRLNIYKTIPLQIHPIELTIAIRFYLIILVFLPSKLLLKFYVYRYSKWYVRKHLEQL